MKKIKLLGVLITSIFLLTGCDLFKKDAMENIDIYTTIYPINYLVNYLYGDNATINSIYPNGVNINNYKISSKKLKEYSKTDLFIFNSLDKDQKYAVEMVNNNSNLKLIDSSLGMKYTYSVEEIWLNPYNYLMMSENIVEGLNKYITNPYLLEETQKKHEELKYDLSKLDATIKETTNNATYKTIVVDNDLFKFLEKYNIEVISLEENDNLTQSTIDNVQKLISSNKVNYIYTTSENSNDTVTNLINKNPNIQKLVFNTMNSVGSGTDDDTQSYVSIMNDNINLLKKELYK